MEWTGIFLLMVLLALSNIGGIGGGGIIIPIAISMFGMATREAIALSNSTIMLGSIARYLLFSAHEKHPEKEIVNKTMIDHSLTTIMVPMVLVGSYVGVLLNVLIPEVALAIFLTLLLFYLTYTTTGKGIKLFKKESAQRDGTTVIEMQNINTIDVDDHGETGGRHFQAMNDPEQDKAELDRILD